MAGEHAAERSSAAHVCAREPPSVDARRFEERVGARIGSEVRFEVVGEASRRRDHAPHPRLLRATAEHEREHFDALARREEEAVDPSWEHRHTTLRHGVHLSWRCLRDKHIVLEGQEGARWDRIGDAFTCSRSEPHRSSKPTGNLGARIQRAARQAVRAEAREDSAGRLEVQLQQTRACRAFLLQLSRARRVPRLVRELARGVRRLPRCVGHVRVPVGSPPPLDAAVPSEWALWAQDDNAGCQTGMLRRGGGSVVLWHTEEDTIGFLDAPRVAVFSIGAEERGAFVYPYLLPGPAFGWGAGQLHAVDSLHTRRDETLGGTLSGVASWLVWRIGRAMDARDVLLSLVPFVDGCAIHVVGSGAPVTATTHGSQDEPCSRERSDAEQAASPCRSIPCPPALAPPSERKR